MPRKARIRLGCSIVPPTAVRLRDPAGPARERTSGIPSTFQKPQRTADALRPAAAEKFLVAHSAALRSLCAENAVLDAIQDGFDGLRIAILFKNLQRGSVA
jgi:hypothetical protein